MKAIGWLLTIAGICGAIYFFAVFDTTVPVQKVDPMAYGFDLPPIPAPDRVHNIGLQQDRQLGLILSVGAVVIGVGLIVAGSFRTQGKQEKTEEMCMADKAELFELARRKGDPDRMQQILKDLKHAKEE